MNEIKNSVKIMDCPCLAVSEQTLEQQLISFIEEGVAGYSVAINAEKIFRYKKNIKLKSVIDNSIFPYPDGAGAVLGLKWLHNKSSGKINMPVRVLEIANKNRLKVFIVGAKEHIHEKGVAIIKERYPDINYVGNSHGYNSEEYIISAVEKSQPQLIMLALGSPRQEIFAQKLIGVTNKGFAIGCGGALDILAGELRRAPDFFINNNLEWLYRLVQEPWRWKRQLFLPIFLTKLIGLKLKNIIK